MSQNTFQLYGRLLYGYLQHWQDTMSLSAKLGWVCAGYISAAAMAAACVVCHVIATSGFGMQADSGMRAFSDMLLFFLVFAIAAVPPTSAMLFLRPYPLFWRASSIIALVVSFIGFLSAAIVLMAPQSPMAVLAFLMVIIAPIFALLFGLLGIFAPGRSSRILLFAATMIEGIAFAAWVISCFLRPHQ